MAPLPIVHLLRSASAAGTAVLSQGASVHGAGTADASRWGDDKYVYLEVSGNSASAALQAFVDSVNPLPLQITAWAQGPGTTATAHITGHYPYLVGSVLWASGGVRTATVNMQIAGGRAGP